MSMSVSTQQQASQPVIIHHYEGVGQVIIIIIIIININYGQTICFCSPRLLDQSHLRVSYKLQENLPQNADRREL